MRNSIFLLVCDFRTVRIGFLLVLECIFWVCFGCMGLIFLVGVVGRKIDGVFFRLQ